MINNIAKIVSIISACFSFASSLSGDFEMANRYLNLAIFLAVIAVWP